MASSRPGFHALLIGIDAYDGTISLDGCVNDIDAVQRVLLEGLGVDASRITRLVASKEEEARPAEAATLANMRKALKRLGKEATAGDSVFIYYSGHGTQIPFAAKDGSTFMREALVPSDWLKSIDEEQYLFDWEVNRLLSDIAARTSSVSVILDCCCSAGATRDAFHKGGKARFHRTKKTFHPSADLEPPPATRGGLSSGLAGSVAVCQVVAACLADETARESTEEGGQSHGELTRALIRELDGLKDLGKEELADLRWGRIWRAVLAGVAERNGAQHPWMWGGFARRVFGGPPEDGDAGYGITKDGAKFRLDVGTLSGVTKGARIAVYGPEPPRFPQLAEDADVRRGVLRVTSAERASAIAVAETKPLSLPAGARGRLIEPGEEGRMRVGLFPQGALPKGLAESIAASPLLELAPAGTRGDVDLEERKDGAWAVTDDVFDLGDEAEQPTLCIIPATALKLAREVLEHYHVYAAPLRLAKQCTDLAHALDLRVLDCNGIERMSAEKAQDPTRLPEVARGHDAPYQLAHGDRVCFSVHNGAPYTLMVFIVFCQQSGKVAVLAQARIPGRKDKDSPPGMHAFWVNDTVGQPYHMSLAPGLDLGVDRVVAIGTTNRDASLDHLETSTTFASILDTTRGKSKDIIGGEEVEAPPPELWTATVTALRSKRSK